jgi:hypothetical protein
MKCGGGSYDRQPGDGGGVADWDVVTEHNQ